MRLKLLDPNGIVSLIGLLTQTAVALFERCRRPIVCQPFDFTQLEAATAEVVPSAPSTQPGHAAVGAALLLCCTVLTAACGEEPAPAPPPAEEPEEIIVEIPPEEPRPPPDPQALYAQHCALCHGPTGDGDGSLKLDRPARSFRQGGFSFGNTEEAVFRTISSGIGGTPMPGFQKVLTEAERRALALHVIALGPEQVPGPGFASILNVGARPLVVRAQFPPLVAGAPEFARGLLIGNTDGLSYQYRADDVRLLAVRQGPFADRKDWGERGGSAIEPLGRLIFLADPDGDPTHEWERDDGAVLQAVLRGTATDGSSATIRYDLMRESGRVYATITETCRALSFSAGSGFVRDFRVELAGPREILRFGSLLAEASQVGESPWISGRVGASDVAVRMNGVGSYWADETGFACYVGPSELPADRVSDFDGIFQVEYVFLADSSEESFRKLIEETNQ
jgi:hypothetical protein